MTNLTNQDNVGNYYFGYRTNNFAFSSAQIGLSGQTLVDWINTSFGETCAALNGDDLNSLSLILPHPTETLTRPAIPNAKFRFGYQHYNTTNTNILSNSIAYFNPDNPPFPPNLNLGSSIHVYYCVLNNSSLNIFGCRFFEDNLNPNLYFFRSIGFLKNPLYSGIAFPRNIYQYFLGGSNFPIPGASRPGVENTGVDSRKALRISVPGSADPIANYPLSCQIATPGANATDLWLRDHDAPNKAIGVVSNLLKTTLDIPVGQIYRNSGIDPDGSDNPYWICVAKMGNESILMRVFAIGLV